MVQLETVSLHCCYCQSARLGPARSGCHSAGWQSEQAATARDTLSRALRLGTAHLLIVQKAFSDALHRAEVAIATAGTATEQFVGLGKPAVTFAGGWASVYLGFC